MNEEQLIAQGADHKALRALPESWIRDNAPRLVGRLGQAGATDQFRWILMGRLLNLADPGLTRDVLLAGVPEDVFCQADPDAAAEAFLSMPRDEAVRLLPKAARVKSLRFLPLYEAALGTPGYPKVEDILRNLEYEKHPDIVRTLLALLPASVPADEALKIKAAKAVYARCQSKEPPESIVDRLAATRATSAGAARCILTAALVLYGRTDGIEDLEPAFPGQEWGQSTWERMLATSPQPEARRFVARMAALGKVHLRSLLWINNDLAPFVLEALPGIPVGLQLPALEALGFNPDPKLKDEIRRRFDEVKAQASLSAAFPVAPGQGWVRGAGSRVELPCAKCGAAAVVLTLDPGGVRVDGPFCKGYPLPHSVSLAVVAAIAAGKERDCLNGVAQGARSPYGDLDPCCKTCGAVACARCWAASKTGTNGGLDIGVWYDVYTGICPNGHPQEYSIATASYG